MQEDFHYYATYSAAILAGYSHEDSLTIAYSDQFVDCCSATYLTKIKAPIAATTTQMTMEMADNPTDTNGLHHVTRVWSSFHFLPYDLYAELPGRSKSYRDKYHLICKPNGDLTVETVKLAKGKSLQAVGVALHVLADTFAHAYFAGTPSMVINSATNFYDIENDKKIEFNHNPLVPDDVEKGAYVATVAQDDESAIMNLGHGLAGHLPDYSFLVYSFMPAWGNYELIEKNNPKDYYAAYCQVLKALKYLKGTERDFEKGTYDYETVEPYREEIEKILKKRQRVANEDWKAFGEKLSGREIPDFERDKYVPEYVDAQSEDKDYTFLGRFIMAALAQKSMVTNRIYKSGNKLAGVSIDYKEGMLVKGMKGFDKLVGKITEGVS